MEKGYRYDYSIAVFLDFSAINRQKGVVMLRNLMMLLFAILLSYATAGFAGDYVLDASTMDVGATAGENLVVKEECPNSWETTCKEKVRWLSASNSTKIGSLKIDGGLGRDFEVILVGIFDRSGNKSVSVLTGDNRGIGLTFSHFYHSFRPNGVGSGGSGGGGQNLPGLFFDGSIDEIKIIVQQDGLANVYANGKTTEATTITLNPSMTFSSVEVTGIRSGDRISEIKVRGIQGSTTCSSPPTTPSTPTSSSDCTADYSTNGSLHVPCVRVPGAFGKTEIYEVWMQQKFPTYSFDLDLNRVTVK
jgi:hypothetical protein